MIYDPKRHSPSVRADVMRARKRGAQLITGLFALGLFASEIRRLDTEHLTPIQYTYLALFLAVGGLAYLWLSSTEDELAQLFGYLDPLSPSFATNPGEKALIFAIAAVLCLLLYATRDVLLFGCLFSAYSVVALLSTRHVNRRLNTVFRECRKRIQDESHGTPDDRRLTLYSSAIDILEQYYNTNKHLRRHVAILVISLLGTAIAWYAWARRSQAAVILAYGVFLLTLISSEAVTLKWRIQRNAKLLPLRFEIDELEHNGYRGQDE